MIEVPHFSYYTLMLIILPAILLSTQIILFSTLKGDQADELTFELKFELQDSAHWERKSLVDFNITNTNFLSFDSWNNCGAIDVVINWFNLDKKPSFKMLVLSFSSKFDWDPIASQYC